MLSHHSYLHPLRDNGSQKWFAQRPLPLQGHSQAQTRLPRLASARRCHWGVRRQVILDCCGRLSEGRQGQQRLGSIAASRRRRQQSAPFSQAVTKRDVLEDVKDVKTGAVGLISPPAVVFCNDRVVVSHDSQAERQGSPSPVHDPRTTPSTAVEDSAISTWQDGSRGKSQETRARFASPLHTTPGVWPNRGPGAHKRGALSRISANIVAAGYDSGQQPASSQFRSLTADRQVSRGNSKFFNKCDVILRRKIHQLETTMHTVPPGCFKSELIAIGLLSREKDELAIRKQLNQIFFAATSLRLVERLLDEMGDFLDGHNIVNCMSCCDRLMPTRQAREKNPFLTERLLELLKARISTLEIGVLVNALFQVGHMVGVAKHPIFDGLKQRAEQLLEICDSRQLNIVITSFVARGYRDTDFMQRLDSKLSSLDVKNMKYGRDVVAVLRSYNWLGRGLGDLSEVLLQNFETNVGSWSPNILGRLATELPSTAVYKPHLLLIINAWTEHLWNFHPKWWRSLDAILSATARARDHVYPSTLLETLDQHLADRYSKLSCALKALRKDGPKSRSLGGMMQHARGKAVCLVVQHCESFMYTLTAAKAGLCVNLCKADAIWDAAAYLLCVLPIVRVHPCMCVQGCTVFILVVCCLASCCTTAAKPS